MRLITNGEQLSEILCKLIKKHKYMSFAVAWASAKIDIIKEIELNIHKIKHSIIGLHFFQTDGEILEKFYQCEQIHFIYQKSGVFHPKCYIFWTDTGNNLDFNIIIGSANLTHGAFHHNQEACIYISKKDTSYKLFNDIKKWIYDIWNDGKNITFNEVKSYQNKQNEYNKSKKILINDNIFIDKNPVSLILGMDWNNFVQQVKQDPHHGAIERLAVLKLSRKWFKESSFKLLGEKERRALAGTLREKYDNLDFNWFGGNIQRQHLYNELINKKPNIISKALDYIPINGNITREQYMKYAQIFHSEFMEGGDGPAIISRLISMKRPDYFVCLNGGNLPKICNDLCISKFKRDKNNQLSYYEYYWDKVIVPIQKSLWWNTKKPNDNIESKIWDFRAALLDSIFYEPPTTY